jgi:tetratricopeptide (TPR) repeat protein
MGFSRTLPNAGFNPDGRLVVTAGFDGSIRIWDSTTGDLLGSVLSLSGNGTYAAFSPDGRRLLVGLDTFGQPVLWDLPREKRPVADLVAWSEVLTGHRLDAGGLSVPVEKERLAAAWKRLGPTFRQELTTSPQQALDWHRRAVAAARDAAKYRPPGRTLWHLDCLIAAEPRNASLLVHRGDLYGQLLQYDKQVADYSKAIELAPNDADLWFKRGDFYKNAMFSPNRVSQPERAIADLTEAIRLRPDYSVAYLCRGQCHFARRDFDAAVADYTTAMKSGGVDFFCYGLRGGAYAAKGDHDRAIADYTQVISTDGARNAHLYKARGDAFVAKGDDDKAILDYTQLIRQYDTSNPYNLQRDPDVYLSRGAAQARKGEYTEALLDTARAIDLASGRNQQAWEMYALLSLRSNDPAGYRKACSNLLGISAGKQPSCLGVVWMSALVSSAVPDSSLVVPIAEKDVANNPKDHDCLLALGASLYRAGRFEDALRRINLAIEVHGKGGTAYDLLFLAMVQQRLGKTPEARDSLDRAVAWIDQATKGKLKDDHVPMPRSWQHRLMLQHLHQEAEGLLKQMKP